MSCFHRVLKYGFWSWAIARLFGFVCQSRTVKTRSLSVYKQETGIESRSRKAIRVRDSFCYLDLLGYASISSEKDTEMFALLSFALVYFLPLVFSSRCYTQHAYRSPFFDSVCNIVPYVMRCDRIPCGADSLSTSQKDPAQLALSHVS